MKPLVDSQALSDHLNDSDWIVVDCRFSLADPIAGRTMYDASHIPGARYADLDHDLSSPVTPSSGRHPLPVADRFVQRIAEWGIGPSHQVVAYDQDGGAFASRLWWLLRWIGHRSVAVLDGGFRSWVEAGYAVTDQLPEVTSFERSAQSDDRLWLTSDQLSQALTEGRVLLVDAREAERYRGDSEPIDPVGGHVPGAINVPFRDNLRDDGTFHSADRLRARYLQAIGDRPLGTIVHMCGSGVTACHNALAMEVAGLPGSKLYAGSWREWIRDDCRPVATG